MNTSVSVVIRQGLAGFQTLEAAWAHLAQTCGSHFLHFPGWYFAQLQTEGDLGVYFVALFDDAARDKLGPDAR